MKDMSIRINVLKLEDVTSTRQAKYVGNYVSSSYDYAQPLEQKKELTQYQIKGVGSCEISDTYENMTQIASFKIPMKDTVVFRDIVDGQGNFLKGYLMFKNGVRLYIGNQVMIDMGYDKHWQTRFIGYISSFKEEKDYMVINLEDSMYMLKRAISMQKNFPKKVDANTFEYTDKYNGKDFNLIHLVYWMLNTLYMDGIENDRHFLVPKTRSYDTELGKVVMQNALTPGEIMRYYLKKTYGMKVFFRNEYVESNRNINDYNYLMEPVLYIGWANWNGLNHIEYDIANDELDSLPESKLNTYSDIYKFMHPYNKKYMQDTGDKYNPIIENNLEWYNTNKDNIKITASSFNSSKQETIKVIYQYGKYHTANKAAKDAEKREKKTNAISGTVIKDSNNLQTFNEITLNYPNLNGVELKQKVSEYYTNYPQSGLRGNFVALGEPYVRQGDKVQLRIDQSRNPNVTNIISDTKNDYLQFITYYVKRVDTSFTMDGGIRQRIEIDKIA